MKIVFFASGEFALPCLRALVVRHQVLAVVTQPPTAAGRKLQLKPTAAETLATELGLPVVYGLPTGLPATTAADIFIVCDYRRLLPQTVLDIPPLGVLNIHPSLLPRWRGAAPIERAILAGDNTTGVSIMKLSAQLDAGGVMLQNTTPISDTTTAGELHDTLAQSGSDLLLTVLDNIDRYPPWAQKEEKVTYAKPITAAERQLDFSQPAEVVLRTVRAFAPAPGAHFFWDEERIKVFAAEKFTRQGTPGKIWSAHKKDGIIIACGNNAIRPLTLQRAGGKKMSAEDFLRGLQK